jgi:arabinogalactan oligomer/maltooligosaccharide transport system permease protein
MRERAGLTAPIASALFMGLGHFAFLKQYAKGVVLALIEVVFLLNAHTLFTAIAGFVTLGEPKPDLPVMKRDNSIFMMIDGLIAIVILVLFLGLWLYNVRDARKSGLTYAQTGEVQGTRAYLASLFDKTFPYLGLSPAVVMLSFFVVIPLLFSALLAFTNYTAPSNLPPANTVDWVGLDTFRQMASLPQYTKGFTRTASWTLVWAFASTITTYFGGLFMALALLDKKIRLAKVFRIIFILPYAVPGMISLLIWANLLNGQFGPLTRALRELGIIEWLNHTGLLNIDYIPWLSDVTMARVMLIVVNLWLGFPYFMLLITGLMTSMPPELYEAATIDGAGKSQQFRYITLPLLIYQTIPLMIMSFSYNMNNFGGVYFLTQGNPSDTLTTQSFAGATDTLMTWIYKLTVDQRMYNKAAVVAILVFLAIAPFAIYQFSQTKSFKEGDL